MSLTQHSQTKPITWANASTRSVDVSGTKFAYRQLGADSGVPVIFLNHLAAELDRWDPRVVDGIATRRRVIVFDNQGIGASEGKTPTSVEAMARDRKSTRLNSSHPSISYAVFCLKKKKQIRLKI